MKVRLHPRARRDLQQIRDYICENSGPRVAERIRQHLKARIQRLGKDPQLGVASSERGIRVLSPTRYPDRIYFTNTADAVVVLHLRHTSRQLPDDGDMAN